jgi:hypothetical protein
MLLEETWSLLDDSDDDWRVGLVLQGAAASREPSIERLRQRWTTKRSTYVRPEVEASAVHERQVAPASILATQDLSAAVPAPLSNVKRQRRRVAGSNPRRAQPQKRQHRRGRAAVVRSR